MRCGGGRGTCARARPLRFVATWWPAAAGKETVGGPRRSCGVLLRGAPPGAAPSTGPTRVAGPPAKSHTQRRLRAAPALSPTSGGLSACPALRRPAGRGMGLPLGTPRPGPPAPRSPTRAAPGLTAPARHPAAHAGDSGLSTTGTPSRVSRPGLAPPRGPAALTAPSSVTFARCKQSQAAPGRATRSTPAGTLEAEVQFSGRGFCLPAQVCAPPTGAGAVGPQAQAGRSGT